MNDKIFLSKGRVINPPNEPFNKNFIYAFLFYKFIIKRDDMNLMEEIYKLCKETWEKESLRVSIPHMDFKWEYYPGYFYYGCNTARRRAIKRVILLYEGKHGKKLNILQRKFF